MASEADNAMAALAELFSSLPSTPLRRWYTLECIGGELYFVRDEIDLALDDVFDEICGPNPDLEPGRKYRFKLP